MLSRNTTSFRRSFLVFSLGAFCLLSSDAHFLFSETGPRTGAIIDLVAKRALA
jgi:hypothetical protein